MYDLFESFYVLLSGYGSNYGGILVSEDSLSLQSVEYESTPGEMPENANEMPPVKQPVS
jgi:hypothetical protein